MAREPVFAVLEEGELPHELDRLACLLTDYWQMGPEHGEIRLSQFLLAVCRELMAVPEPVLFLVRRRLIEEGEEDRVYKPTLAELKRMCIAGMKVRPYLRDHFRLDVDHAGEPWLPPPRPRRRRVILDDEPATKPRRTMSPYYDDDDDRSLA